MQFLEKIRRWKESINTNLPSVWVRGGYHYVGFWGTKKHFRKELPLRVIEKHFRKCWAHLRSFCFTGSIIKENEGVLGGYRLFPFGGFTFFMYQILDPNFVHLYRYSSNVRPNVFNALTSLRPTDFENGSSTMLWYHTYHAVGKHE